MPRKSIERLPEDIISILKQDPNRVWSEAELIQVASNRTGFKSLNRIRNCLRWMIVSGSVKGTHNASLRSQTITDIRYQETETEKLKKLQSELDRVKKEAEKITSGENRVVEVRLLSSKTDKVLKKTKGVFHSEFETLLNLANARENIFIYGPTGCGKTFIASQLAQCLKLPFGFLSCTVGMSEGQIAGRLVPTVPTVTTVKDKYDELVKMKFGKQEAANLTSALSSGFQYIPSEFVNIYENGGVFLFDEMDAADPNVLLLINSALANGTMAVPNRPDKPYAERHENFVCLAAANTVGTGADRSYSGRNKLDAATLDRFQIGKVFMDYDENIEKQLCPDFDLYSRLLSYRRNIRESKLERALSTRFMQQAYNMKTNYNWTNEKIDKAFFQGWSQSQIRKVKGSTYV